MYFDNKSYLKNLEDKWFERLVYKKDGQEPNAEQLERIGKNSRRNAKHTLTHILEDRLETLKRLPQIAEVNYETSLVEKQLEEINQYNKPRQPWDINQDSKGRTTYKR